ncbi:hypothetical protein GUJ93_ZPchr0003g18009 [Zizania palustris]|uniref:Transcription factor GAMYB n=1 Tax=Zizania palustris TaxID=103762 RepID=A0A8J5RY83_ZIZPA|nr:hypothetical protein GUJ93_ZPchr0003g18009 [Zizania palustris]
MEEKKPAPAECREKGEEVTAGREEQQEEVAAAVVLKKGPWTSAEDAVLVQHVRQHGEGNWNMVQRMTGLLRCGKSCRLRWTNHLRPNLKKGSFSPEEELLIAQLHAQLGNKWARMASHMPGRTDNEIKNYWNTRTKRRQRAGLSVYPPEVQLHVSYFKRCRYADSSPLSLGSSVLSMDEGEAASARYTCARTKPLDLAGQLAMANRLVHFLAPTPFSAPSSPWGNPFAWNAQFFHFPHSSPVSPTTPTGPVHSVTPELSLGYGLHGGDQTRLPPVSPSPSARVELPSSQLRPAMSPSAATPTSTAAGLGGGALHDPPNPESIEAMLQELHDAIKIDPVAPENRKTERDVSAAAADPHGVSDDSKPEVELKDDVETLLDLIIPASSTFPGPEPNHWRCSVSRRSKSNDGQDHSNVVDTGLGMDLLPAVGAGGAGSSSEQDEWSVDGDSCQWNEQHVRHGIC